MEKGQPFQQIVLEQLAIYRPKKQKKLNHKLNFTPYIKNNSGWIANLNVKL